MKKKEKTLGELREFLMECIYEVKSEKLSIKKANEISKMGVIVCQTYYLERAFKSDKQVEGGK